MAEKNYILDAETAAKKLQRMSLEIVENIDENDELIIIGIAENGMVLANSIVNLLQPHLKQRVIVLRASLDKKHPSDIVLSREVNFTGSHVIIIDDVSNSGRTLLYTVKPLLDHHPKKIQTLVLVERMHKQFAVKPDYVGLSVATTLQNNIVVQIYDSIVSGAYVE